MPRQPAKTLEQVEEQLDAKPENKRSAPKELVIERSDSGLYQIVYTAGGETPDSLKGLFTNVAKAQAAVDNHRATQTTS